MKWKTRSLLGKAFRRGVCCQTFSRYWRYFAKYLVSTVYIHGYRNKDDKILKLLYSKTFLNEYMHSSFFTWFYDVCLWVSFVFTARALIARYSICCRRVPATVSDTRRCSTKMTKRTINHANNATTHEDFSFLLPIYAIHVIASLRKISQGQTDSSTDP